MGIQRTILHLEPHYKDKNKKSVFTGILKVHSPKTRLVACVNSAHVHIANIVFSPD